MTGPKMNGYHVHMSEISKGQGLQCAAGAPSWHALSKEEKDRCAAKAAEVRLQAETDPASLKKTLIHLHGLVQHSLYNKEHLTPAQLLSNSGFSSQIKCGSMSWKCNYPLQKLGHLGIDSGVMLVEKKTRCCEVLGYGVVKTIFLNSDDVIDRIKNQYGSSRDGTATVAELQEHVRSKMNGVASRCTLKFKGFPWKAVQAGKVRISGWPAGLKKYVVSSMSRNDLKRLLDAEIVIHGLATTEVEQAPLTVPASTTGPTTVDEQAPPAALDNTTGMESESLAADDTDGFMNEFSQVFGAEKEEVMDALITEEPDSAALPSDLPSDLHMLVNQVTRPSQKREELMSAVASEESDPAALLSGPIENQMGSTSPAPTTVSVTRPGHSEEGKKGCIRKKWSAEERKAIGLNLTKFIATETLPGKADCLEVQQKCPILRNRKWTQIKFCVKNMIVAERRKLSKLNQ